MPLSQTTNISWRKSSHSGTNANCIEVAAIATPPARDHFRPRKQDRQLIAVRDSKCPNGTMLFFNDNEWSRFIDLLRDWHPRRSPQDPRRILV